MEFQKIALLAFLCLPIYILAFGDAEERESTAPAEHTKELTDEEKKTFEEHLKKQAQDHYKNGDITGLRTWNYKNRANDLDNDIKRHLIDSSEDEKLSKNLKQLKKEQLQDLQERLQKRIEENEKAAFSSKGLRGNLMALSKTVVDYINQKNNEQGQSDTITYYKEQFTQNIQDFSNTQNEIDKKQKELQQALTNAKIMAANARNENNPDSAQKIEADMKKIKEKIKDLTEAIQNSIDRTNLNQENISTALLKILEPTISQEDIQKLTLLIRTIEITKFIDMNAYENATSPKGINDPKINHIKAIIRELLKITPHIPEITTYINFLKKEVENHFINLENKAIEQHNNENSNYFKLNEEIKKIEMLPKFIIDSSIDEEIQRNTNFIKKELEEPILALMKELEELEKNPELNEAKINAINASIENKKNQRNQLINENAQLKKSIEPYKNQEKNNNKLIDLEKNRKKSVEKSAVLLKLQQYFATQAKAIIS